MDTELDNTVVADALSPLVLALNRAALESLVRFRADDKTQVRFERLAEKASDGTITATEQREFDTIIRTSSIVAVLQAQAERVLAENHHTTP